MTALPQNPVVIEIEAPVNWRFTFDNVLSTTDMTIHRCLLLDMVFVDGRHETVTLPAPAAFDAVRALHAELEGTR